MTKQLEIQLIEILQTKDQANLLDMLLSDVIDNTYSVKNSLIQNLRRMLPANLLTGILEIIKKNNVKTTDKNTLLEFLKQVQSSLRTLPTVSLTVGIKPTYQLQSFLMNNLPQPYLLDLHYNPDILGGLIIQYKGEYKDYSLKKVLERKTL